MAGSSSSNQYYSLVTITIMLWPSRFPYRSSPVLRRLSRRLQPHTRPYASTSQAPTKSKPEGDISSVFVSLSSSSSPPPPLPPRFAALKSQLVHNHEEKLQASWERLLDQLKTETALIRDKGSSIVPEVEFADIRNGRVPEGFRQALTERGVGVVRAVVSEGEALGWKEGIRDYLRRNPGTKGG